MRRVELPFIWPYWTKGWNSRLKPVPRILASPEKFLRGCSRIKEYPEVANRLFEQYCPVVDKTDMMTDYYHNPPHRVQPLSIPTPSALNTSVRGPGYIFPKSHPKLSGNDCIGWVGTGGAIVGVGTSNAMYPTKNSPGCLKRRNPDQVQRIPGRRMELYPTPVSQGQLSLF